MTRTIAEQDAAARDAVRASGDVGRSGGHDAPIRRYAGRPGAGADPAGPLSAATVARLQAAVTALAPAVVAAGLLYHPHIGSPRDPDFLVHLAAAVAGDPGRWAVAHLLVGVGSGLLILAFLAIRSHLRGTGEDRWSALALPFVVMGSLLFALLPAMEFAPLAAAEAGVDVEAVQAALLPRLGPMIRISAVVFGVGALGFAAAIVHGRLLSPALAWVTAAALVVMAASRFLPLLTTQLYIGPLAGIVALWPLAFRMWRSAAASPRPLT